MCFVGGRVDAIVCTDQESGDYLLQATYDFNCPRYFDGIIPMCSYYSFLRYDDFEAPFISVPTPGYGPMEGQGGGRPVINTNTNRHLSLDFFEGYGKLKPLVKPSLETQADANIVLNFGIIGEGFDTPATSQPLESFRWYFDYADREQPRTWRHVETPLLHTKAECVPDIPIINFPEGARTVDIVINNLSPAAHVMHLHGMRFKVLNLANFHWVKNASSFTMRYDDNPCEESGGVVQVSDPNNPEMGFSYLSGLYWGCKYIPENHKQFENIQDPIERDVFLIQRRSWAVIRVNLDNPGVWPFHCHVANHAGIFNFIFPFVYNLIFIAHKKI